jgi:CRP-like cAMP-binding protein
MEQSSAFSKWPVGSFVARLSSQEWDALQNLGSYQQIGSGYCLYNKGIPATNLLLIVSGTVTLVNGWQSGDLLGVRQSGDLLGDREALEWGPHRVSEPPRYLEAAWTITPAKVLRVPAVRLNEHIEHAPRLWRAITADLYSRLAVAEEARAEAAQGVPRRLALALLALWPREKRMAVAAKEEFRVTQGQMASWIGASQETVQRILRGWRERGIVATKYGRIEVCKLEKLLQIAGQGDAVQPLKRAA